MVYSGLEFGQYFELNRKMDRTIYWKSLWITLKKNYRNFPLSGDANCSTIMTAITPISRMILSIIQMQFIFLNTTDLDMGRHKVISRFGLMHMVATNLCEWLYVLVEETKHEIHHLKLSRSGMFHLLLWKCWAIPRYSNKTNDFRTFFFQWMQL